MSEYVRQTNLEDVFMDTHGIKPQIFYRRIDKDNYEMKLLLGDKEIILTDQMNDGLTTAAYMEYQGNKELFDKYYLAENRAVEILKG